MSDNEGTAAAEVDFNDDLFTCANVRFIHFIFPSFSRSVYLFFSIVKIITLIIIIIITRELLLLSIFYYLTSSSSFLFFFLSLFLLF